MSEPMQLDEDWQSELTLPECLWTLHDKQVACDVIFEIGPEMERIGAHSVILMSRSKVFFSQFITGLPETEICIPAVAPEEFLCFLRYLYTGTTDVSGISMEKILYLAETYHVGELIKSLLERQLQKMEVDDFCPFVRRYERHMTDLVQFKCLEYVFKQPFKVFQSATFQQMPLSFLGDLLDHERLVVDEDCVCTALLLWASKWCEVNGKEVNGANQREALGDVLYKIRFPLLTQDYFTENISEKGLLTENEEVQLLKYFLTKKKVPDNFNGKKREAPSTPFEYVPKNVKNKMTFAVGLHAVDSLPILSPEYKNEKRHVYRFGERGIGWGYRSNKQDAICVRVNREISLTHVFIYGNCKEDGSLDVTLEIKQSGETLSLSESKVQCSMSNPTGMYEVGVENEHGSYGIKLKANVLYDIVLTITGNGSTYYGKKGREKCEEGGIEFEFYGSEHSSNNTNVNIGQIPGMKYTVL